MKTVTLLFVLLSSAIMMGIAAVGIAYAVYDLPNDDGNCPGNCRKIPWQAGSDQWNGGSLPNRTEVNCIGLTEGDGTTDNASAINTCLSNISAGKAVKLPPGIFYVNAVITIPTDKTLKGSGSTNCSQGRWLSATFPGDTGGGATCTTLKLGASGYLRAGTATLTRDSEIGITGGYTKGSTQLTLASVTGLSVNDWVSVFEDTDSAIVSIQGCDWCGENNGSNLIQQFARITAINGTTITISRELYYTYQAGNNPGIKKVTWSAQRAGLENLKLHMWSDVNSNPIYYLRSCLFCWAKGLEAYNASGSTSAGHIRIDWSHGAEVRDSYLHHGRSYASGDNYGVFAFFWNSDHKVENNIMRIHRHSTLLEGGGSGIAWLYNYIDDNLEDNAGYNGSARTTHGPHPMFSLWEGNHISHLEADDVFGGSSHIAYFRNWLRGESTDSADRTGTPSSGFYAIDVRGPNRYYAAVGNILGESSWSDGTVRTLSSADCSAVQSLTKVAYYVGCQDASDWGSNYNNVANTSFIAHGNYDYITDGVAHWEGGADHTLRSSMYYSSKPAFFGSCAWPAFGPDLTPITGTLPAKDRYENGGVCVSSTSNTPPSPPVNLRLVVQ